MNSYVEASITVDGIRHPVRSAMNETPAKKRRLSPLSFFAGPDPVAVFFFISSDNNGAASRIEPIARRNFCLASRSGLISVKTSITAPATASTILSAFLGSLSL